MDEKYRIEKDSLGDVNVPIDALYGAQTQRAVDNFYIGGESLSPDFIKALALIKVCAAKANKKLNQIDDDVADAIVDAASVIVDGDYLQHFPIDIFQTGSGTSSNMNANEVIAALANKKTHLKIHPNDHVNYGQSSNDVIPTAIHISCYLLLDNKLLPAVNKLINEISIREVELAGVIKTGRTHLMDAMPLSLAQELSGWRQQLLDNVDRIISCQQRLKKIAQGGTAIGTGVNTHPQFAESFACELTSLTQIDFSPADNFFSAIGAQDTAVELSAQLKVLATSIIKISNDIRWMSSGPLAGLNEITLKALQPGSSIMPGKVNPVIPEAVLMAATQVIGNDLTVSMAGQSGNFQLNVMLPLIASNLIKNIYLLANSCDSLSNKVMPLFTINNQTLNSVLNKNPILVTALNSRIGYSQAAAIAKKAYQDNENIIDVAEKMTDIPRAELEVLLDPAHLIKNKK